jgi:hypothetical protein
MSKLAILILSLVFLNSLGCAVEYNNKYRNDLLRRATFDLNCPAEKLTLVELQRFNEIITSYGVTGCEQRATYVLGNSAWVMNNQNTQLASDPNRTSP